MDKKKMKNKRIKPVYRTEELGYIDKLIKRMGYNFF